MLSDITKLPYRENSFDKILCTGVLIHDDPKQVQNFVSEASRVLRPKGDIVVSITHPYLYEPVSPARTGKAKWLALRSKENRPLSESQQFEEDYLDKDGEKFESVVWHHPREFLLDTIKNSGLEIEQTQDVYITSDVVHKSPYWGDEINYPVFWQIKAIKPKNQ